MKCLTCPLKSLCQPKDKDTSIGSYCEELVRVFTEKDKDIAYLKFHIEKLKIDLNWYKKECANRDKEIVLLKENIDVLVEMENECD